MIESRWASRGLAYMHIDETSPSGVQLRKQLYPSQRKGLDSPPRLAPFTSVHVFCRRSRSSELNWWLYAKGSVSTPKSHATHAFIIGIILNPQLWCPRGVNCLFRYHPLEASGPLKSFSMRNAQTLRAEKSYRRPPTRSRSSRFRRAALPSSSRAGPLRYRFDPGSAALQRGHSLVEGIGLG